MNPQGPRTLPPSATTRQRHLRASWNPPVNTGPDIHDYDVQYRVKNTANPNDGMEQLEPFSGAGNTTTLSELERGTIYEARVKAHNPEGSSDWSPPGEGSTRTNIPPVLAEEDTSVTRSVPENSPTGTPVGDPVSATDEDIDDEGQLQYSLQGTDVATFDINQDTGQIQVREPLNYEDKDSYQVAVKVTDNQTGSDTVEVNIAITDLPEKPSSPAAPTVEEGKHANTLDVSWTEPDNTGPAISDYDLRYREQGAGSWKEWEHEGPGITNLITMLTHSTIHQVQIRAYNDERWSEWSMPGSGTTAANRSPTFSTQGQGESITLTLPETLGSATDSGRDIGTPITATDPDQGDSVSYSLEGTDAANFTVTSTGQVRTKADRTYDHEKKEEYTAVLAAEDDEVANTGRATVKLVIEITDENEPPLAPAQPTFTGTSRYQTTVNWQPPDNTGRPNITHYEVRHKLEDDSEYPDPISTEEEEFQSFLTLINLEDGKSHDVQVRGINEEGEGAWSRAAEVNTPANKHPVFQQGSSTTRDLPENSVLEIDIGSPITATDQDGDTITYTIDGENEGQFAIDYQTGQLESGDHDYNHEAADHHIITVVARDSEEGRDEIEVRVNITDLNEAPDQPENLGVTQVSSIELKADWDKPNNDGRPAISGYDVQYRKDLDTATWADAAHTGTSTQASITGLQPSTTYQVQVRTVNHEGRSGWTQVSKGTTSPNNPPVFAQGSSATRSVPENSPADTNVGTPVTATDFEGTALDIQPRGHRRRLIQHHPRQRADPDEVGGGLQPRGQEQLLPDGQGRRQTQRQQDHPRHRHHHQRHRAAGRPGRAHRHR